MGHTSDAGGALVAVETGPLVSIIIPCYNGGEFLHEAIESALAQTYRNVEIIVLDDGSTDSTAQVAQSLPVRYIYQLNRGLCETRNRGVRESKGSYIVFLDADDRLLPKAVETGLRVLTQRPECAMAVGNHLLVGPDGMHLSCSRKPCLASSHYERLLRSNFIEMISSILFRRGVLEEVGGFNTKLRVAEDYDLYLRIARLYPICSHPAVVAEYRMHQRNASHNSELMLNLTLQVLRSQAQYIRGSARRLFAFLYGLRNWRRQYGRRLAVELAWSFHSLDEQNRRRKLLLLAKYYPQGLLLMWLLRIFPRLGKAKPNRRNRVAGSPLSQGVQAWLHRPDPQSSTQTS